METKSRTQSKKQFDSVHLYLEMVASALNDDGHTMQDVMEAITKMEVKPTKILLKEAVWKQILFKLFGKDSTTKQEPQEINEVYDVMNKWLGQWFQIHVPFPTQGQSAEDYEQMIKNTQAYENF